MTEALRDALLMVLLLASASVSANPFGGTHFGIWGDLGEPNEVESAFSSVWTALAEISVALIALAALAVGYRWVKAAIFG